MLVSCPNQHSIEVLPDQYGLRLCCPICQIAMFVTPSRGEGRGGVKFEARCPIGHKLRVKPQYLSTTVPCPQCEMPTFIDPAKLVRIQPHSTIEDIPQQYPEESPEPLEVTTEEVAGSHPGNKNRDRQERRDRRLRNSLREVHEGLDYICNTWFWLGHLGWVIGLFKCRHIPAETGARWPLLTCLYSGLGLFACTLLMVPFLIPSAHAAQDGSRSGKTYVLLFGFLVCLVNYLPPLFFLKFMKELARFMRKKTLSNSIGQMFPWGQWGLIFTINILVMVGLVMYVVSTINSASGQFGVTAILFLVSFLTFLILLCIYGFLFLHYTYQIRHELENYLER